MSAEATQFCSSPTTDHTSQTRQSSNYDPLASRRDALILQKHSYKQQYASVYYMRLIQLGQATKQAASARWSTLPDKPRFIRKILDIQAGEFCYMVGTVYLEMPAKPNVMNNLEDEASIVQPVTPIKYRSDQDVVSLEDESGRVEISGNCLDKEFLVTGMVVAILGKEVVGGVFEVVDVCLPGMAPQPPLPAANKEEQDKYVAIISGLDMGDQSDLKTQLLTEFLSGELGSSVDATSSASITRVILAGNSVVKRSRNESTGAKKYGYDSSRYDASPMLELDELLTELCSTVNVDIMPGPQDPSPLHLPQQPMNTSLFKDARSLDTFHTVTNPYWCQIDGLDFLGTSGQNLDDIYRYVASQDKLKMAEKCMYWRHVAPSAPDTLWTYPFQDKDPFILNSTPHVYFIGNQQGFEQSVLKGPQGQKVTVVLVPKFNETGTIVLVNLKSLQCSTVTIKLPAVDGHNMDVDE